ncbi:MAG TPA: DUF3857 domain-containing protein [Candidatus Sulfotelmatobacter sp.]|nr:DUF3857 domain-containing protein [Candidatus Sulfotelmatobacter sp.]
MLRSVLQLVLRFVIVLAITIVAAASPQEAPHFSEDAAALYRTASQIQPPAGADVLVLEDQESVVFDAEGKAVRSRYLLYKVLTQKGADEWDDFSYAWEPWREEHPSLRARVITPDNAVHPLDPKTITDSPAKENEDKVFSDRRELRAPLPAIAPGSLVEEEQTTKETAPFPGSGMLERIYFGFSAPVQHTRLTLDAPSTLPLRYNLQLLPGVKPQRTESGGRVQIVFDSFPLDPFEEAEPQLPSDSPAYANVTFSTGSSWQHLAEEYSKIVDKQIASADLKPLVTKLIAGKNSRDEKAAAIVQYLDREVRYTGVEFGDAAVVPRSPTEALTRKYGDCKDKAALLVAMFRAANIPAYVALLNGGSRQDVSPDLPGMGMFDHAIVYVPGTQDAASPVLWIDATDEYSRLGQIPVADQERLALIARPETTALSRTPATSSADNALIEKREIFLAENGPARVVETSLPHGSIESSYRRSYADKQNKDAKDELTDYVKSQYLAEKLDRMDRSDPADLSKQFELVLETNKANRGFTELTSAVAAIRLEGLFTRLPPGLQQREKDDDPKADADGGKPPKKQRVIDFQLPDAYVTEWQYTIVPPAGFKAKPLPKNAKLYLGPAALTEDFSADEKTGVVHVTIRFDTVKRRMSVSEATEMSNKVAELRAAEAILLYFEPVGAALLSEGKVREALQSYHDLVALHPKEAVHHLQIAETLLAAGMGEAARSEARAAVKLEPTSALAQKTLGDILQYDLVGRKLYPGSDFDGAVEAMRTAVKLDPDDKATVGNLAILLEHNREGMRYGTGAKLTEAISTYRTLTTEKIAGLGLQNNLAFALFYAGEFAEARKNAETLNPQPNSLIVACEAALHGSQAGLAEAKRRSEGEDRFRETVKSAGEMLMNLRKYLVAADLLEAGANGNNASQTVALAAMLRKARPHEELNYDNDPAGAVMQVFLTTADPNLTIDRMMSLSSHNAQTVIKATDADELDRALKTGRQLRRSFARTGSAPDVMLDIMMEFMQPKVEGNDASGYRATLQIPGGKTMTMFVVKEDGKYKMLDDTDKPNAVGLEILDRIAAGNLDGARMFLDWLRETQHLEGGDDPLAGQAFPRFWTKGKDADTTQMKLAAAAILVQTKPTAARGVSILEAAKDSAHDETARLNIGLALIIGYGKVDEYQKSLALASDLAKQYSESKSLFFSQLFDLIALQRFDDADKLAEDRLRRISGDIDAMRAQVRVEVAREDYAKAHELDQKIVDAGKAEAGDFNNIAWHSLYIGKVASSDIEDALKSSQLNQNNASTLHTLGCVYAEVGKTKEAREVLIQAMDLLDLDEPDDNYWYAFGRIAEQFGERNAAIADYNRVNKPKKPIQIPDSSYRLAQLRLQALHSTTEAATAKKQ